MSSAIAWKNRSSRLATITVAIFLTTVVIQTTCGANEDQKSSASNDVQPTLQPASDEGQRAIATFTVPQGMKVELAAAEPDLANPVSFCFDEQGRIYVTEAFRIKHGVEDNRQHLDWLDEDLAAKTVDDRLAYEKKHLGESISDYATRSDRIRLLEDRSGGGKIDHSTVFADGFNNILDGNGAGVLPYHGDVFYTCIPHLWKLRDDNGDGRADQKKSLSEGYGVKTTLMGHDLHGLIIGPDGKLYFSIGDRGLNITPPDHPDRPLVNVDSGAVLRCNLDGSDLEIFATGLRNPQRLAFDDYGNLFSCDNNSDSGDQARWVYIVEGGDSGWRNYYQYLPDRGPFNREKLWYPHFDGQAAYIVPPCGNLSDGPSGVVYDPGVSDLPEKYRGCFFLADFRGMASTSGIRAVRIKPKGAGFEVVDNQRFLWSVLATDVQFGPDCKLYVLDWVQGWDGPGKGRIYRMVDTALTGDAKAQAAMQEVKKLLAGDWTKLSTDELLKLLEHADRRVRQEAQFELANRKATKELTAIALHSQNQLARIHALWAMGQIGLKSWTDAPSFFVLTKLFDDSDAEIRAQSARVLGNLPSVNCDDELIRQLKDSSPRARFFAAMALGKRKVPDAFSPLVQMIAENNDTDPFLRHAAIMGLVGCGTSMQLAGLKSDDSIAVRLAAVVSLRRKEEPMVTVFLQDRNPQVLLEAARAIHDVPITEAIPQLAKLIDRSIVPQGYSDPSTGASQFADDKNGTPSFIEGANDANALMRRVLNANYILGKSSNANAVASIASNWYPDPRIANTIHLSDSLHIEALDMLGNWGQPSNRDRILNAWRPIEHRSDEPANSAMSKCYFRLLVAESYSDTVRQKAIEAIGKLRIDEAKPTLLQIAFDRSSTPKLRIESLRALDLFGNDKFALVLAELVQDGNSQVRSEARRLLVKLKPEQALQELRKAIENGELEERQQALAAIIDLKLPGTDELLESAMDQLLDGRIPAAMQLDLLEAAQNRGTPKLKEQLARYKQSLTKDDPLAEFRPALYGGDAAAGLQTFRENIELSCKRCHKVGHGAGGVGPELTSIATKLREQFAAVDDKNLTNTVTANRAKPQAEGTSDEQAERKLREYLLESIVLPSKTIAKGFESVIVVTDDGLQHSGVLQNEDDKQIRLMTPQGIVETVAKSTVEERKTGLSAMPADLVNHMTKRQLRDLVEFLANLNGQFAEPELSEGAPAK